MVPTAAINAFSSWFEGTVSHQEHGRSNKRREKEEIRKEGKKHVTERREKRTRCTTIPPPVVCCHPVAVAPRLATVYWQVPSYFFMLHNSYCS